MTQTASIDLGAMVANRQAQPARPASKPQSEFVAAYRQASEDNREPVKQRETDRPNATRPDNNVEEARERQAESSTDPVSPTDIESKSQQAEAPATETEAPKTPEQAPVAEGEPAPQAEAPPTEVPVQTPEEAQAMLALMLATGAQVAAPAPTAQTAEQAAEAQAVQAAADVSAQVQAELTEATANAVKAQANAQVTDTPAETQEAAPEAAKVPAAIAQAAQGLGKLTVQTEKAVQPTTPVVTAEAAETDGLQNLSLQLLADTEGTNTGSITQGALLDDATGIETTSQFVNLLTEESDEDLLTASGEKESGTPLLNGDRPLTDSAKATQAQAKDAAQGPVKAEDVMPQILKYADQIKANQQNSIKLQLYPEHLGKMEIKVTSHAGVISAQLTADSHQVKSMLESQVAMLQRTFAELGLKVDKVEVALSSSSMQFENQSGSMAQGDFQQNQQQQQHDARRGLVSGSGYEQWLGDDVADADGYVAPESITAVNYVA